MEATLEPSTTRSRSALKNLAQSARRDLKAQIVTQAGRFGLSARGIAPPDGQSADSVSFGGQVYDSDVKRQYQASVAHLQELAGIYGSHAAAFAHFVDEAAYTWFNRLVALRYLEVQGWLPRVLSSDSGSNEPELLRDAVPRILNGELALPLESVNALREQGDENGLYRLLLIAQCNALSSELPFLFDTISAPLALVLPPTLLNQDSLVRRLVREIPEADWHNVEIVGWLYQYYISERKDEVIGAKSKVAAADIPAATQLFTPAWIVQYMVQNSLGRLWLESHPSSALRDHMPYYLDSPPQNPEVQALIDAARRPALRPEDLTVLDPACGSGHILVYAFDLLVEIYREQGHSERAIPALILEHNLVGLDIDPRAAQLARFALMMKARALDRRALRRGLSPQVLSLPPSRGLDLAPATWGLQPTELAPWQALVTAFADADTLGSLITPPPLTPEMGAQLQAWANSGNGLWAHLAERLQPLYAAAQALGRQYDVVVANPPYMGGKSFDNTLKAFAEKHYRRSKADLYAIFLERSFGLTHSQSYIAMIVMESWMFLSSYQDFRKKIHESYSISQMLHMPYDGKGKTSLGINFGTTAFVIQPFVHLDYKGRYQCLRYFEMDENTLPLNFPIVNERYASASAQDFEKIPGAPVAYWAGDKIRKVYQLSQPLSKFAFSDGQVLTGNNDKFIRFVWEVSFLKIGINNDWAIHPKGGDFRKWYGNLENIVNWSQRAREHYRTDNIARIPDEKLWFKKGLCWTAITSGKPSFRLLTDNSVYNKATYGMFAYGDNNLNTLIAFLNTNIVESLLKLSNPTLNLNVSDVQDMPIIIDFDDMIDLLTTKLITLSKTDWDAFETSWDFAEHPLLTQARALGESASLEAAFAAWEAEAEGRFRELQRLETENNRYWIDAYGLQDELTPEVPDAQITVRRAERERDAKSLIAYAVGCLLGRYSLDAPGLVHAGQPFDPARHTRLPADNDGIMPINDLAYFPDDLGLGIQHFLRVAFGETHFSDNLRWLAESLGVKKGESPVDTLRRYLMSDFVKDHNQTYRRRPIYWLFTSGKKRAFNAIVYLHRYQSDTLARLRTDYLHPLQGKLESELRHQEERTGREAEKRAKLLREQLSEMAAYDNLLRDRAEARIALDLDDGVAYNYTLFEGLVYEGADLKMADLKKKSQWKRNLLKQASEAGQQ